MNLKTLGAKEVKLFTPEGFELLQIDPKIGTVERLASGEYNLKLRHTSSSLEVSIPARPKTSERLGPLDLEALTAPVGISNSEWPDEIKNFHFGDPHSPEQIAKNIEKFLNEKYKYSLHHSIDPIEALKGGSFKCDMAALIMVGLLRDRFKIPSRVVSGYRAKGDPKSPKTSSALVLPDDPHAWVEAYIAGRWITFDPTPLQKEKSEDEKESDENLQGGPPAPASKQYGTETDKRTSKPAEFGGKVEKHEFSETTPYVEGDLSQAVEKQLISLKYKGSTDSLLNELIHLMMRESLSPSVHDADSLKTLEAIRLLLEPAPIQLRRLIQSLRPGRTRTSSSLAGLTKNLRSNPIEDTFKEFYEIYQKVLAFKANTHSHELDSETSKTLNKLVQALGDLESQFRSLESKDAEEQRLALGFLKSLPPLTRQAVQQNYNIKSLTPGPQIAKLSADLRNKTLAPFALIREVYSLSNFITLPVKSPQFETVKTWRYHSSRRGRDYAELDDFSQLARAMPQDPSRSLIENLRQGTLIDPGYRVRSRIPAPTGETDPERITIVLYDTSGSMNGGPGDFQAALIGAFADRALSDRSKDGRHRHRLVLMGFDTTVHKIDIVNSAAEAIEIIRNYRKELVNTNGSTDIMNGLGEAFRQILLAQGQHKEPLANANILLLTDGVAPLDSEQIRTWRDQINRKTMVQLIVGAIGGDIPELKEFIEAPDTKKSINLPSYMLFDADRINEAISQSLNADHIDPSTLVSQIKASQIPEKINAKLMDAIGLARDLENRLELRPPLPRLIHYKRPKGNSARDSIDLTPLAAQLQGIRNVIPNLGSSPHLGLSFLYWLREFEKSRTGGVNSLTLKEKVIFEHLLKEINGVAF